MNDKVKVEDIYPDLIKKYSHNDEEYFDAPYDYTPIINHIGRVIVRVDDSDYQGDTRVLLESEFSRQIGWVQFGWGSCSGCDALQACESVSDVQSLVDEIIASVKWFHDKEDALKFFNEHDWEGDYSWHHKEQRMFIDAAKIALGGVDYE